MHQIPTSPFFRSFISESKKWTGRSRERHRLSLLFEKWDERIITAIFQTF
jgi:hypothetical protein